jgi:hypothetical protein
MDHPSDSVAGEAPSESTEKHNSPPAREESHDALALGFTMAILAFVGAIVVLSIPHAVLSVPLPADVDRLGLSVGLTQGLLFGQPWYLLVPATLIALWVGYRSYRWARSTTTPTSD